MKIYVTLKGKPFLLTAGPARHNVPHECFQGHPVCYQMPYFDVATKDSVSHVPSIGDFLYHLFSQLFQYRINMLKIFVVICVISVALTASSILSLKQYDISESVCLFPCGADSFRLKNIHIRPTVRLKTKKNEYNTSTILYTLLSIQLSPE